MSKEALELYFSDRRRYKDIRLTYPIFLYLVIRLGGALSQW